MFQSCRRDPTRCTSQRADFDRPLEDRREPAGDRDRLVQVGQVEHVVPAELFDRLGERPVGNERPAVPHADGLRGRHRLQRGRVEELPEFLPVPLLSCITFGPPMWLETGETKVDFLKRARQAVQRLKDVD